MRAFFGVCMYVCMCVCVYRCCWVVAFGFPQTSLPRSPDLTIAPFGHLQAILTLANVLCNSKTLNNLYLVDCGLSSRTFLDILTAALSMHPASPPPSLFALRMFGVNATCDDDGGSTAPRAMTAADRALAFGTDNLHGVRYWLEFSKNDLGSKGTQACLREHQAGATRVLMLMSILRCACGTCPKVARRWLSW